ncbi:MAG: hypothetical protein ACI8ZB_000488 [Desulforhopalus sp.]|jgi:hypothetical protein
MSSQNVAYLRVSCVDQSLARQKDAIEAVVVDKLFTEKASAKDTSRYAQKFDWRVTQSFLTTEDRISCTTLYSTITTWKWCGV